MVKGNPYGETTEYLNQFFTLKGSYAKKILYMRLASYFCSDELCSTWPQLAWLNWMFVDPWSPL